jgi:hypothetical protein
LIDDPKSTQFDPYSLWLGIPPGPRPPGPEAILGLQPGGSDPQVVRGAALERKKRLQEFVLGPHRDIAVRLEREVSQAMVLLTSREPADRGSAVAPTPTAAAGKTSPEPSGVLSSALAAEPGAEIEAPRSRTPISNAAHAFWTALGRYDRFLQALTGNGHRGWLQSVRILSVTVVVTWSAVIGLLLVFLVRS